MENEEGNKLPPIVNRDDDEEDVDDFASVIAEQSETIKKQEERIAKLLEAVENLTKAGANYQQGNPPKAEDEEKEEDPYKGVMPLAELDFRI